jgi:TolA-binding protein
MHMKLRTFILLLLSATLVVGLNSCRPRSQKTAKKQTKKPPTDTTKQNTPTAKSVMSRADSVLANLSSLTAEERDMPQVTPSDYPNRTPWGAPQDVNPDPSGYKVLESGLASFNASDYQAAIGAFSQIASSGRPPELVPNAYYWMGESYYGMNRFAESIPYFEYTAKAGPAYKRETAFYKIAMASSLAGNDEAASTWAQRLRAEYPKSKYIKLLKKAGVE